MANNLNPRSRSYLVGGAYGALVLGFLLAGVGPFALGMVSARGDIRSYQVEIDQRLARAQELQDVKKRVALIELETRDFDRLVPPNQDLGQFLTQLYEQLDAAGMKDITARNLVPTALGRSQKLPIEVRGKCTYSQFHDFLVRLEGLPRLSSVGRLNVKAETDMSGNVEVELTLFIYSAKPAPREI
jgi:Tfp pilus assembly protein PilO